MKSRRNIEIFSLSFLDCICCGFGALILLLVLSKTAEPVIFEQYSEDLDQHVADLEGQLFELHGQSHVLNRELVRKKQQVAREIEKVARLQGELSSMQSAHLASRSEAAVQNTIEGQLARARQTLSDEIRRLQSRESLPLRPQDATIAGIPVDSEYIIFIIDTSGSMLTYGWQLAEQKLTEVLDAYPRVKGLQVMNDMGEYMFRQYAGRWIPDTPARRKAVLERMRSWQPFSNSSPVEGITAAIQTFHADDKKISLYVFGDEFTGPSIQAVLREVNAINRKDVHGNRRVRIHAVGFPVQFARPEDEQVTGVRFATLMRALCKQNEGTFIGLASITP